MIIKFARPTRYESRGRSGFIATMGVEITDRSIATDDAEGRENTITLHPITSRGEPSEACRVCIAKSALPEVIAALREILEADRLAKAPSKQAAVITMLQRPDGATEIEMANATGWQRHTVRGLISGTLKKKLGLTIVSAKEQRGRVYRIAAA